MTASTSAHGADHGSAGTAGHAADGAADGADRPVRADLQLVRWIVLAFLVVDCSDEVIGLLAPSAIRGPAPTGLDVFQSLTGLLACALVLWERYRAALLAGAVLVAMMLPRHLVGIEPGLLLVSAATVAIRIPAHRWAPGLAAVGGFGVALVVTVHRDGNGTWTQLIAFYLTATVLVVGVGVLVRRLGAEREASRRTLRRLHEERIRVRETERRQLATELESALTERLDGMRQTLAATRRDDADVASLRRAIAGLAASGRSMLADLRVMVHVLRDPAARSSTATGVPTWIELLHTSRARGLIAALAGAATVALAVGEPTISRLVAVLSTLALALACWRRSVGVLVAVAALGLGLATPDLPLASAAAVTVVAFAALREGRWHRPALLVVGLLAYVALHAVRFGAAADTAITAAELGALIGAAVAITLRHFHTVGQETAAGIDQLREHRAQVARDERTQVARELHDVVGHQLSAVALHTLATEGVDDRAVLHGALDRIGALVSAAEVELASLVRGLETSPADSAAAAAAETSATVSQVADELAARLDEHGFTATFDLDPAADALDATTAHTAIRFLQETTANALRHAAVGPCTFVVDCQGEVTLQALTPLAAEPAPRTLPGGWGLRGLGERVELLGGRLSARPEHGTWTVSATIPSPRVAEASL